MIGGQVLHSLTKSGIKASITVLVRDAKKGRQLIKAYPEVEIVMGDLDDSDLIEREASHADIVLRKGTKKQIAKRPHC